MIEKALPVDDPSQVAILENYADLLENYAELLEQLGRGEEAAELRARIEAIRWRQEPPLSPS
jgi:hypothetical protein